MDKDMGVISYHNAQELVQPYVHMHRRDPHWKILGMVDMVLHDMGPDTCAFHKLEGDRRRAHTRERPLYRLHQAVKFH